MNEERVIFESGSLKLEGLLAKPDGPGPVRAGVVCHPHPLYGGSMYNNVVDAALQAIWELGWASLRFNFRGVGESEGKHGGGAGEAMDAAAAVKVATSQAGVRSDGAALVGSSFGRVAAGSAGLGVAGGSRGVAPPGDAPECAGSACVVGGITYPDCNLAGGAVGAARQIASSGSSGSLLANSIIPLIVALRSP